MDNMYSEIELTKEEKHLVTSLEYYMTALTKDLQKASADLPAICRNNSAKEKIVDVITHRLSQIKSELRQNKKGYAFSLHDPIQYSLFGS